ncbi:hypothetical protein ABGB07_01570 [Micromonosporaceae bacterium B7E4]
MEVGSGIADSLPHPDPLRPAPGMQAGARGPAHQRTEFVRHDRADGSDIEAALHEVGAEVLLNGGADALHPEFVLDTFANTYPLSRTNPEQIEEIRARGRERAIPAGRSIGAPSTDGGYPKRRVLVVDES